MGTAASSRGVATVLKRYKPGVRIVAVEPAESSVLLGGQAGPHKIEGVGIGYTPPLWDPSLVDEIVAGRRPTTRRTWRGASRGRRPSSRGRLPERTSSPRFEWRSGSGPEATVVTLMADSGLKYLSTDVYRR